MASTKSSRVNPNYKKRYPVGNWQAYERGLRARGDVTVWFAEEALSTSTPPPTRCRGGQRRYSNLAILTALTLRMLFHLPLRQTEGFVASLLRLMGLDLNAPDHTTLSRRNRNVLVPALRRHDDGPIHLIVDLTGLKIYGAGEWCSRKHRKTHERGGWRKLHLSVDDDGYVVAAALTQNTVDDADMLPDLLGQIGAPLRRVTGDGAYDTRRVYNAVGEAGGTSVEVVVPPRQPATASPKATGPEAEEPVYREDWRDRKTGVAEGDRLPAAGPRRGHIPPVQTDPRRQPPCEGVRSAGGMHRAERDVGARDGAVLRGHGVTVGDCDTGSVPWSNHAPTPRVSVPLVESAPAMGDQILQIAQQVLVASDVASCAPFTVAR